MKINVEILSGIYAGRIFFRRIPLLVGRGLVESEEVLDLDDFDPNHMISQQHCEIIEEGNDLFIIDLGSKNGTFIFRTGKLIQIPQGEKFKFERGDFLVVGELLLKLEPHEE